MLRVCHIISADLWAGAEVMACHLLKGLHLVEDIELTAILLNEGRLADELRTAGVRVQVVPESSHSFLGILQACRKTLQASPPHVIHSHRYKENLLAFLLARSLPGARLVSLQHGLPEPSAQPSGLVKQGISKANEYALKHRFDTVVVVSKDMEMYYREALAFPAAKVVTIHNGVVLPEHPVQRPAQGDFVVGSSGRLFPVKDYPLMVAIARELSGESLIRFALAGEGPERGSLEKAIDAFGLSSSFRLEGHLDNMEPFYQGLDVYMNTSMHEGIPMAILEAMARGLPVIAPRVGGIPEVVQDGVEGFLVDGRDPRVFAEKCLALFRNRGLWERMSQAARSRVVRDFSVERMTAEYVKVYRGQ